MKAKTDSKGYTTVTTPRGVLKYPKLVTADTKFDAEGTYSTKFLLPGDEDETKEFMALLDDIYGKGLEVFKKENPKKSKTATLVAPYHMEVDDEGNETGNVEFSFKRKATGKSQKTGKTWQNKVALYDAKGKPTKADPWGGTIAKLSVIIDPPERAYSNPAGVGVTVRLDAVQIIELKAGGERDAKSRGFEEEEGYEDTSGGFDDESSDAQTSSAEDY